MPSILWNPKFTAYAFWFELELNNVVEKEAGTGSRIVTTEASI